MFTALIRAGRVLKVEQLSDLTSEYKPTSPDTCFSVFLMPASGSSVELGDVVLVNAKLPYGSAAGDVPVVVGDWSPVIFESISASGVDLTDVDVYVAPFSVN